MTENMKDNIVENMTRTDELVKDTPVENTVEQVDTVDETVAVAEPVTVEEPVAVNEPVEAVISPRPTRIKKHLTKPVSRRERRKIHLEEKLHERAFDKRNNHQIKRTLRTNIILGSLITLAVIMLFRYVLKIDMATILEKFMTVSLFVSAGLTVLSIIILFKDRTMAISNSDPITDFFIIKRGRVSTSTKKRHLDRINTRFMMVTLLKLYKKEQIAIVDERIIYGTMEGDLTKDEVALLNFMLDHNVTSIDDFVDAIAVEETPHKRDQLYAKYKESILEMAQDKYYINQSINKAKFVLRAGAAAYFLIVVALIAKGDGTLLMLSTYGLQAIALFIIANLTYANSKGAHERLRQLRKEKRILQSNKAEIYTSLIYNYLFGKEQRILKKIQKRFEGGSLSPKEYQKFSETYNGFNYILNQIKYGK